LRTGPDRKAGARKGALKIGHFGPFTTSLAIYRPDHERSTGRETANSRQFRSAAIGAIALAHPPQAVRDAAQPFLLWRAAAAHHLVPRDRLRLPGQIQVIGFPSRVGLDKRPA
jgi:hypothetical protein